MCVCVLLHTMCVCVCVCVCGDQGVMHTMCVCVGRSAVCGGGCVCVRRVNKGGMLALLKHTVKSGALSVVPFLPTVYPVQIINNN